MNEIALECQKREDTASDYSLWDVLIAYEPEIDDGYGVARVELKKAVEALPVRYRGHCMIG